MYLDLGHHSVHGAAAAWMPVSRQLGAVESSVVVARSSGDGGVGVASYRWQHSSLDRIRFSVSGSRRLPDNLVARAMNPTYLYSAVRQGPTNRIRVGRPRSGRRSKGPIGWRRSTNILPLNLTTIFQFHIIYFCSFHYRLAHRACFIVTVNCQ